jgi:hypothetical protein
LPVGLEEKKPEVLGVLTEEDIALLAGDRHLPEQDGDGHDGGDLPDAGGGQPSPSREWRLVPAVVVAVLIGALLTFLGMLTQIWANLAGSQLPGS